MKIMLLAATALTVTGSALAYQTTTATEMDAATTDIATTTAMTADSGMALSPPHHWTAEQRALWDQHRAALPAAWTADQRAAFESMMAIPPASWTPEHRALYEEHMASLPTTWTVEQRALYEQQIASLRTPWLEVRQTASADTAAGHPDLRTFAGMGGPYEEVYGAGGVSLTPRPADANYPPCDPGPGDDNCIQLYERGVRDQLASWSRPTGGLAGTAPATAMGGPYEPADDTAASAPDAAGTATDRAADPVGTSEDDTVEPVE